MSNPTVTRDAGRGPIGLTRSPMLVPGCIGLYDEFTNSKKEVLVSSLSSNSINQEITEDFLVELENFEKPFWKKIGNIKRAGYKNIEDVVIAACTIAYHIFHLVKGEAAGIIIKRKNTPKPFEFTGPTIGIGWLGFVNIQIPKGTVYQGWYHSHDESPPSGFDEGIATTMNLPAYLSHSGSGRITRWKPVQVSNDRRKYEFDGEVGKVNDLPYLPLRILRGKPMEIKERELWKKHLEWQKKQLGHWINQ